MNLPHGRKTRQYVDHDTIFIFFKPDYPGHYRYFYIELATRFHIIQKGKDDFFQETSLHPATVVEVANLRGGIGGWEFPPRAAGGQFREDAIEDLALVNGRATAPASLRGWRKKGLDQKPLFVGEVHFLFIIQRKTKEERIRFLGEREMKEGKDLRIAIIF